MLALALAPALYAQSSEGKTIDELKPYMKEFYALPEQERRAYIEHQQEASRLFNQKRIFESLEELRKAEKIFDKGPETWNLRGSCYVELRAFDKALKCFDKALEIAPENLSVEFNIAEVHFVSRQWQKAHDAFKALLEKLPEQAIALSRISEFKLLLCKIKLGKMEEAVRLANKYDYLDDSPYHYYAKAVLAFEEGDENEAQKWMSQATRIFSSANILAPWHDTMIEVGYVKSFFGGDRE
ncbi:MAG: tetratricopeptide repeat protein [Akkermansiaceae bacterium]|nr:tetratricopeptide repeat protein [Akkermansiaceae bacterium]